MIECICEYVDCIRQGVNLVEAKEGMKDIRCTNCDKVVSGPVYPMEWAGLPFCNWDCAQRFSESGVKKSGNKGVLKANPSVVKESK